MSLKRKQYFCPKCGIDKGFLITKKVKRIPPEDRPCKICRAKIVAEKTKGRIAWNRGIPLKEETKLKLRECNLGKPSPTKGKVLSLETKIKLSCSNRDLTVAQFDHFTTPINESDRVKIKKSDLRNKCFQYADFSCDVCLIKGGKLNAHHLYSFSAFPQLRFEVTNLVCLCLSCHQEFHNRFGTKNNTKEQYIIFKESYVVK